MTTDPRRLARQANVKRLLRPKSLAFIGGSRAARSIQAAQAAGFAGPMYAVNPKLTEIEGIRCYPTVDDLPEAPDATFVLSPIDATIEAVRALDRWGAGAAVCFAAGFAELGKAGEALQEELVEASGKLALVGPNCYGYINYVNGGSLWPSVYPKVTSGTGVAALAQSGNFCIHLCQSERSVPWSYIVSVGNQAALGVEDYIPALVEDEHVRTIGIYLEGLKDVQAFHEAALLAAERGKPIVVLKSGMSQAGARVALSHTSSVAGTDSMYDALFERTGIIRVRTIPEMEETLKLLSVWGAVPGKKLVAFSASGGDSGLAADYADLAGLEQPQPNEAQRQAVLAELPEYGQVSNPVDFTASLWGMGEQLERIFVSLMSEGSDKGMLVVDHSRDAPGVISPAVDAMSQAMVRAHEKTGKPGAIACMNPESMPEVLREKMIRAGVAPLQGMDDAMRAISKTADHAEWRKALTATTRPALPLPVLAVGEEKAYLLDEKAGKEALSRHGLATPKNRAATLAEVAEVAEALGFPVAVKALHKDLPHKTEAGAVALNIRSGSEAKEAAERILKNVAHHDSSLKLETFLVEKMADKPLAEVLVGVKRDPRFGLCLVVGAGGILVELLKEATTLLLPVRRGDVEAALRRGALGRILQGYRGKEAADIAATVDAVMAVAAFAEANNDRLVELDVNPLLVMGQGKGALAVDTLVRTVGEPR